jgi:MFS family permease
MNGALAEEQRDEDGIAPYSPARRRYILGLLVLIYTLGFLDRQVINILAEPIKLDLGLGDGELGALTGLAFALFYTLLGVPIARLADRYDRSRVIAGSLAIWSSFTALCGAATGFASLFAMRVGVGVGEAGCSPPAVSLIADIVPRAKRASAMAIYALGNPLGSLIGLAFGGIVAAQFGWRVAFLVAGLPGLAIALVVLTTLRDPRRDLPAAAAPPPKFGDALKIIGGKPSFWLVGLGAAMMAFISYGKTAFYASFFLRNHADGLASASAAIEAATGIALKPIGLLGLLLGILLGTAGGCGVMLGGWLADRAGRRDIRGYMTAPSLAAIAQIPFFVAALYVDNLWLSLGLLCVPGILTAFWFGPVFATITGLVPARARSMAGALLQLVINIIGLGFGPLTVGLISSALSDQAGDGDSLRMALAICSLAGLLAAGFFHAARRYLARDMIS